MVNGKYIIACVNGVPPTEAISKYAAWIAKCSNKELKLFHTIDHEELEHNSDLSGNIGLGARDDLLKEMISLEHEHKKILNKKGRLILESAKRDIETQGYETPKVCLRNGSFMDNLVELKENISLAVIGRYGLKHHNKETDGSVGHKVESIIRSVNKPVLVVSKEFEAPTSIVLAYNGSKESKKALDFISSNSFTQDLSIHLLYAGEKTNHSTQLLADAEKSLRDDELEVISSHINDNIEDALATYILDNNISIIAMGAFGHNWLHGFFNGSFTSKMLQTNERPLLLVR